jgi:hypothetical protein
MAGLGAAFLFVPFFYWMGVPLAGSWLARFKLSGAQLKRVIGILLWGIALKIVWGLL